MIAEIQLEMERPAKDRFEGELRGRLDAVKLTAYQRFLEDFYGAEALGKITQLAKGAALYRFADLRVSVAALNSCEAESHRPGDHRGVVSREQAEAVMEAWGPSEGADWRNHGRAHVLSCGSLTLSAEKLPAGEPASCQLIRLDVEREEITARRLVYVDWARTAGEVVWGAFVADSAEG